MWVVCGRRGVHAHMCVGVLTVQQCRWCVCVSVNTWVYYMDVCSCMKGKYCHMPKVVFFFSMFFFRSLETCCLSVTIATLLNTIGVEQTSRC